MSYQDWLDKYAKPTIYNIYLYLKDSGIYAVNIKDIFFDKKVYALEKDFVEMSQQAGFELIEIRNLENIKRTFGSVHWEKHTSGISDKADENIYVFKKKGFDLPKKGLF